MTAEGGAERLTFLFKIIDDNQATIRFLDTKAGFGIAILGAIVGKVLLDRSQLTAFTSHGPLVSILSTLFALTALLSAICGFRTVFPTVFLAQNVSYLHHLD